MAHGFRKFISEVFVNGKFPKIFRYTVSSDARLSAAHAFRSL